MTATTKPQPYPRIACMTCTIDQGTLPPPGLNTLRFPSRWLRLLRSQYRPRHTRDDLPVRALADLLRAVDRNIVDVANWGLDDQDKYWIASTEAVPTVVVHTVVATWASVFVTADRPHIDWYQLLDPDDLERTRDTEDVPVTAWTVAPNGTAAPTRGFFQVLPGMLAAHLAEAGLPLLHPESSPRHLVLGPTLDGPREAVEWPPRWMPDRNGDAPWSLGVRIGAQTAWQEPEPRIHIDLVLHRWLHLPLSYSPNLNLHAWLLSPGGILRPSERPTFLRVPGTWRGHWMWSNGLEQLLTRLSQLPHPALPDVLGDPLRYLPHAGAPNSASDGEDDRLPYAAIQYQSGMRLLRPESPPPPDGRRQNAKTCDHPVNPGFMPINHHQLFEAVTNALATVGVTPTQTYSRRRPRGRSTSPRLAPEGRRYQLEFWNQTDTTRRVLLNALQDNKHGLALTPAPTAEGPTRSFNDGSLTLSVSFHDIGELAAALRLPAGQESKAARTAIATQQRLERIRTRLGSLPHRDTPSTPPGTGHTAALIELDGPRAFTGKDIADPKTTLRKGFAHGDRVTQFLRPITATDTAATEEINDDELLDTDDVVNATQATDDDLDLDIQLPPEDTEETAADRDLPRAANAIRDALRQLGHVPAPHTSPIGAPIEVWALWYEPIRGGAIPILLRHRPDGTLTTLLPGMPPMPYSDLHLALATGRGRLPRGKGADSEYTEFLLRALTLDDPTPRLLLVGGRNLRSRGWAWLQTQHMRRDVLILPGADPRESADLTVEDMAVQQPLARLGVRLPSQCPGLRIARVIPRDSAREVPHVFAQDDDRPYGITSGLFEIHERLYYALAPKPVQAKAPIGLDKFDPARPRAAAKRAWNPGALEIALPFLQQEDTDTAAWAQYVHSLRTAHLHTTVPTRLPAQLHLADLAGRYIDAR
ncbi:hypothetical protein GCM10018980_31180 [Streptomyces capoamus]|uniref:DUF3893 domain-containing protein n=2 Tax=Streptomyces capoamus TaxID=68183 RepID=A0A919C4L4_9ACTN|nr:hypothetical protein GCM10010501_40430 [Streptomyces libani subsp. rufus]GHG49837.1 hypothetical protein GCM10018980_31180 [Streptomyces capoamus]